MAVLCDVETYSLTRNWPTFQRSLLLTASGM
jgi:hypothetical protein